MYVLGLISNTRERKFRRSELFDTVNAIRSAVREAAFVDIVAEHMTDSGPPEIGPWYVQLIEAAARPGSRLRVAVQNLPAREPEGVGGPVSGMVPLLALAQAGVALFAAPSNELPPYAVLAVGPNGTPNARSAAFHWGPESRTTAFDGETHLRPLWVNRGKARLKEAKVETDAWFERCARPVVVGELLRHRTGCTVHAVRKGQPVDFARIFASVANAPIERCLLEDPYLMTMHQMKCFGDFLRAVQWDRRPTSVMFTVVTHTSDPLPGDRFGLTHQQQKTELERILTITIPGLMPKLDFKSKRFNPIHMRYAAFELDSGRRTLFVFERGLDIEDPRTGKVRQDTYVLEFRDIPPEFARIVRFS